MHILQVEVNLQLVHDTDFDVQQELTGDLFYVVVAMLVFRVKI